MSETSCGMWTKCTVIFPSSRVPHRGIVGDGCGIRLGINRLNGRYQIAASLSLQVRSSFRQPRRSKATKLTIMRPYSNRLSIVARILHRRFLHSVGRKWSIWIAFIPQQSSYTSVLFGGSNHSLDYLPPGLPLPVSFDPNWRSEDRTTALGLQQARGTLRGDSGDIKPRRNVPPHHTTPAATGRRSPTRGLSRYGLGM